MVQIEGKITWRIEELWDGGVIRGPFGTKETAIRYEKNFARAEGFIDDLVIKEVIEKEVSISGAVEKDSAGNWHCLKAIPIEIGNRMIALSEGMTFTEGTLFWGVDVAKWLDEHYS